MQLFFYIIFVFQNATCFMHTHSLQKKHKPDESRRVCHSLSRFLPKNFLVKPKPGDVICDKCQRRHYREKEQNTHQAVNCTESCKWNDYTPQTSKPKRDNNISSPSCVRLSISSTSKTHSIAFYARNLILSLSKFNLKQDFLHFFTKKL